MTNTDLQEVIQPALDRILGKVYFFINLPSIEYKREIFAIN